MINRRRFLLGIGQSILGAAIALKIPESLIPKIPQVEVDYAFGWTGYDNCIKGRILAAINLEVAMPRMNNVIYMEDC